ncbi:MAG: Na+/H+ antiporter NhaC family protein, partial [Cetobacterium sp.]
AAKADLYAHIKQMSVTTVPAMIIAAISFTILGMKIGGAQALDSPIYTNMLYDLSTNFKFNLFLIIPPLMVLGGAIFKKSTVPVLVFSSAAAMLLGFVFQNFSVEDIFSAAKSGFNASKMFPNTKFSPEVLKLLNRGGVSSMFEGAIYVVIAFSFGGILSLTKCLEIALQNLMKPLKTISSVVNAAGFSATLIVSIAQNSYISYFLVSDIFSKKFKELNLKEQNLSRILEDFVTVLEGIMPWTISGIYMATTLDVPVIEFFPYAIFNWSCTVLSILYALTYKSFGKWAFSYNEESVEDNSIMDKEIYE